MSTVTSCVDLSVTVTGVRGRSVWSGHDCRPATLGPRPRDGNDRAGRGADRAGGGVRAGFLSPKGVGVRARSSHDCAFPPTNAVRRHSDHRLGIYMIYYTYVFYV